MRRPGKFGVLLGVLALLLAFAGVAALEAQAQTKPSPKENDQGVVHVHLGF